MIPDLKHTGMHGWRGWAIWSIGIIALILMIPFGWLLHFASIIWLQIKKCDAFFTEVSEYRAKQEQESQQRRWYTD